MVSEVVLGLRSEMPEHFLDHHSYFKFTVVAARTDCWATIEEAAVIVEFEQAGAEVGPSSDWAVAGVAALTSDCRIQLRLWLLSAAVVEVYQL